MEREAKLANRLDDQSERGVLVEAVRKGIPRDYSCIIANIGFGIPRTYPEWKARIITMYKERTKDGVYAQTHFEPHHDNRRPLTSQKPNTATSSRPAAGGMTSSLSAKQNDWPRDDRGKWYMPKGVDTQMQIDAQRSKLMSEGRCFRCQKKGHLLKDCPDKAAGQQVRAIEAAPTEPPKDSQMKDEVGKRVGCRVSDSTTTTKDLSTGVHVSSAGRSLSLGEDDTSFEDASSFILQTFYIMRIRIYPPPPPPQ